MTTCLPEQREYRPLGGLDELPEYSRIMEASFHIGQQAFADRVAEVGPEHYRVLTRRARPEGMLCLVPMGQWFGGRAVDTLGVAMVGIAPEARGRGAAAALMQAAVEETLESGTPLSTLYPATWTLYRKAGYELAGRWYQLRLRLKECLPQDGGLEIRRADPADAPRIQDSYAAFARHQDGLLDRGPYVWGRVLHPRQGPAEGYLAMRKDRVEGYAFVALTASKAIGYDLFLSDFVAATPEAGYSLLAFLARHRSLGHGAVWNACPEHPLLAMLPERCWSIEDSWTWMLRIADLKAALEARGYAAGLRAVLDLEITDELLPRNAGRFRLEVEGGRAVLRPGGDGRFRTNIRHLAGIYTGFFSPWSARAAGWLDAPDADMQAAAAIFAGSPWMADMF